MQATLKPLLIGQAPNSTSDARRPLEGPTLFRLKTLTGLEPEWFKSNFELKNLVDYFPGRKHKGHEFPLHEAVLKADYLAQHKRPMTVMLGKNVACAFGYKKIEFFEWDLHPTMGEFVVIPHTSGVNRLYNQWDVRHKVKSLFAAMKEGLLCAE